MQTPDQIIVTASQRYNPKTGSDGQLLRQDVAEFLAYLGAEIPKEQRDIEVRKWLRTIPFVNPESIEKIISDLDSYI